MSSYLHSHLEHSDLTIVIGVTPVSSTQSTLRLLKPLSVDLGSINLDTIFVNISNNDFIEMKNDCRPT